MKVKALPKFEGIRDNERNVYPKAGEVWEVSEERAKFLLEHEVVEIVEEQKEEAKEEIVEGSVEYFEEPVEELKVEAKPNKKKK